MTRLAALALLLAAPAFAAGPLRVCADPDNLPCSRADGSGFENRIAELVAADMKVPLRYEWLPDRRGFERKTLGARKCDVIVGVPADFERTANTHAYYRSAYAIVERAGDAAPIRSLDDPRLARLRVGVQLIGNDMATSPPGAALARHGYTDGDPASIFASITQGRPGGMPSFGGHIPDDQVWQIVAYVRSMGGQLRDDVAPSRADGLYPGPPENARPKEPVR